MGRHVRPTARSPTEEADDLVADLGVYRQHVPVPGVEDGVFSTLTALNVVVTDSSRVAFSMGRERPNMNRPYEVPYYPITPILGIALALLLTGVLVVYLVRTDLLALGSASGGSSPAAPCTSG